MSGDSPVPAGGDVTQLLQQWGGGDRDALERLMPLVYDELRRIAARYLSAEKPGHLLQRTALVHEAFLRLVDQRRVDWQNRSHFYGLAARLMRRILVDQARHDARVKRGEGARPLPLEAAANVAEDPGLPAVDTIALDRALTSLEAVDPAAAELVTLRFFGGLTVEETAGVLNVSERTVKRDWAIARAWLHRAIVGALPTETEPR